MSLSHGEGFPRCANCDIVIEWGPTVVSGQAYCCIGCARGGPCCCDYSQLPSSPIVLEALPEGLGRISTARYARR
jgi:hypothetical protein